MKEIRSTSPNLAEFRLVLALGLSILVSGCSLGGPDHLDPKEPYPVAPATARATHHYAAALVIFTEAYLDVNIGDPDAGSLWRRAGYTIYNEEGKKVRYVGESDQEPSQISLEPGRFLILLDKPAGRIPAFWVKVELGRITEVRAEQLPKAGSST